MQTWSKIEYLSMFDTNPKRPHGLNRRLEWIASSRTIISASLVIQKFFPKVTLIPRTAENKKTVTLHLSSRKLLTVTEWVLISDPFPVIEDHFVATSISAFITPSVHITVVLVVGTATRHPSTAAVGCGRKQAWRCFGHFGEIKVALSQSCQRASYTSQALYLQ